MNGKVRQGEFLLMELKFFDAGDQVLKDSGFTVKLV